MCVAVWIEGAAKDTHATGLVALFERAIGAMWRRAQVTLGDVTLAAIVERVLYTASMRFPTLTGLEVETTGVRFEALRARIDKLDEHELVSGIQFTLVEFLTVLGHLTAEILTPALHAELSRVTLEAADRSEAEGSASTQDPQQKRVSSS
jgi:hypothetical protein